ncbi:MAG: zf-TFIIB domain-containing protein [Nitriliruptorales bacterium]
MQCPVDGATLEMSERQGIEIDYCPQCRGVWLDRGELDKIIERTNQELDVRPQASRHEASWGGHDEPRGTLPPPRGKRRRNFLEELFD